jgi:ADP-heptose:LPS heptosyltransferase
VATLVVHPGPLGDVLLAVPALRALRRRFAGDRLVLAAQSPVGTLVETLRVADARVRFERLGLDTLFVEGPLDARTHPLRESTRVVCWFGAQDATFVQRLTALAPGAIVARPWVPDRLVWQHLLATIGERAEGADRQPVHVPAALADEGRRVLKAAGWDGGTPLVVLHPGASGAGKRWPVDAFAAVLERVGDRVAVMIHEGPSDAEPARALSARLGARVRVLDNPTLPVLAAALSHAHAFLGSDSGVSHLAASVGTPSVVLFTPALRTWAPWSPCARAVIVSTTCVEPDDVNAAAGALAQALA